MWEKMNELLRRYLEMKGKHHTNLGDFFAEILTETKGKALQQLMNNGFKDIRELKQFLFPSQIKEIKKELTLEVV